MKKPQLQLDDRMKDTIASEIAELFFEFWQNRRTIATKQEAEAVASKMSFSEDSQNSEATALNS